MTGLRRTPPHVLYGRTFADKRRPRVAVRGPAPRPDRGGGGTTPGARQLTVTCSPRHGPDESVDVAARLTALGHSVTVHVAARMVRDRAHLDELLGNMARAGVEDLFLVGGDATPPHG